MINQTALNLEISNDLNQTQYGQVSNGSSLHGQCPSVVTSKNHQDGPFVWPKSIQGIILSAYFYGYMLTQIPGGWLAFRFGAKRMLLTSMGVGSIITCLIPSFARFHYVALIICLFVIGVSHGAFWPSISTYWAYWAPAGERARLVGMATSGARAGNIIALTLGGLLCSSHSWSSIFYVFGACGLVWVAVVFFLTDDSPADHRFISNQEKLYILEETKKAVTLLKYCQRNVPWKSIILCKATLSVFIGQFAFNWGNYLFLTQTPSFLKDVHNFDIKSNGYVSSIPYLASWLMINLSSVIADCLLKNNVISIKNARRLFSFFGLVLPGICVIILSFIECTEQLLAVAMLTLGVSFDSLMFGAGYIVNINDIAGPYSGIVFGISNTISCLAGIIAPNLASSITKHGTQHEWQIVFIICACVYFVGAVLDVLLLDAKLQSWANITETDISPPTRSNITISRESLNVEDTNLEPKLPIGNLI